MAKNERKAHEPFSFFLSGFVQILKKAGRKCVLQKMSTFVNVFLHADTYRFSCG